MTPDIDNTKYMIKSDPLHLEPRVVKLEASLDILTKNVTDLTTAVRENAINLDIKLERLTVAVTEAAAPKKTDWSTIMAAVMMIMAIGAAVLIPLNNLTQDNKVAIERCHESLAGHIKIDMHPVGWALVQRLESKLDTHIDNNDKDFASHILSDQKEMTSHIAQATREHNLLSEKFQVEISSHEKLMDAKFELIKAEINGIQGKNDLYIDKLFGRVQSLETERIKVSDNEHSELMKWRQKAMGLSSPNAVVPLVTREDTTNIKK